ncbi:MAG: DedA family protein [Candidatus Vogelbacteria bacterium]|nr:DedA family protein [Candidatus Vogelbacteria bacterium]
MLFSSAQILQLILQYRYFVIFPIAVVEGPIVTIICGLLSSRGIMYFSVAFVVLVLADLVGDFIYYAVGYWGGQRAVRRFGKFLRIDEEQVLKLSDGFESHGGKILMTGKLSHVVGAPILVTAGLVKYPIPRFLWFSVIATFIKTFLLLEIGYYLGEAYDRMATYLDYVGFASSLLVVVAIVAVFYYLRKPLK